MTRDQRKAELMSMWRNKHGQLQVLSMFHRALPAEENASAGMSVFEVILDEEFGPQLETAEQSA